MPINANDTVVIGGGYDGMVANPSLGNAILKEVPSIR